MAQLSWNAGGTMERDGMRQANIRATKNELMMDHLSFLMIALRQKFGIPPKC